MYLCYFPEFGEHFITIALICFSGKLLISISLGFFFFFWVLLCSFIWNIHFSFLILLIFCVYLCELGEIVTFLGLEVLSLCKRISM